MLVHARDWSQRRTAPQRLRAAAEPSRAGRGSLTLAAARPMMVAGFFRGIPIEFFRRSVHAPALQVAKLSPRLRVVARGCCRGIAAVRFLFVAKNHEGQLCENHDWHVAGGHIRTARQTAVRPVGIGLRRRPNSLLDDPLR